MMESDLECIADQFECSSELDEDSGDVSETDIQEAAAELENLFHEIGEDAVEPQSKRRRL